MMKKTLFLTFVLFGSINLNAQTLKDLKNKVTGQTTETTTTTGTGATTAQNGGTQYEMAEAFFNSGSNYSSCRFTSNTNLFQNSTKTLRADFFREVKKDADNKMIEFSNKLGNDSFKPNEVAYPMYFVSKGGGMAPYIYFIDGYAICTKQSFSSAEEIDKAGCSPWEIYCVDKSKFKGLDCDKVKALLKAHVGAAKVGVDAVRAEEKAAAEKLEAEKRAKYTTKGKEVTKIRIVADIKTMQQGKTYGFTVISTLKDGSEISTANGGYIDEFDVSVSGLPVTFVNEYGAVNTVTGTTMTVPMEAVVAGDKVVLTIKSKFHPTLSTNQSFIMVYTDIVTLDYNGDIDQYGSPRHGGSLRVEIKAVSHGTTGEKLLEYKVFSKNTGLVLKHFKVSQTSSVNLLTNGKSGKSANLNPATNGTNGGNSTIVVDPSVKAYTLNITYEGGRGGSGDSKHPGNGIAGTRGSIEKLNQSVNW